MAEAAENNVTPISADSKLTDEQKRDQLRARIEAGEKRNEERSLGDQAKEVADSAIEFTKKHPLAVVGGVLVAGIAIGAMTRRGRRLGRRGGAFATLAADAALAYGARMVDGVLVIGQSDQFARIEEVAGRYRPMVVWGNHQEGQRHCVVGSDNRLGGRQAAERLIAQGARRLAFLGDPTATEFAARYTGAKLVADAHDVPMITLPTHLAPDRMAKEVASHIDQHAGQIDGIFAATDILAMVCLAELAGRQIAVPDDIRVVGFDDLPLAEQTAPPLTTVRQDIRAGAFGMVDLLLRRLAGEETESLVMQPELVVRQSA